MDSIVREVPAEVGKCDLGGKGPGGEGHPAPCPRSVLLAACTPWGPGGWGTDTVGRVSQLSLLCDLGVGTQELG